jgi:hypothetical protein
MMDNKISLFQALCDNSCPPLNPIAKSRYKEMNLDEEGGISRSLFNKAAIIPNKKNNRAGLVRFEIKEFISTG